MSVCSKFVPNFFNKNKCQSCFKSKKCHIDQNLEKNQQTTRTVIRCSFLFVSPECHSVNTTLKVKKWQRRWFILYSDAELTYSLDQSSLTLPQNIIRLDEVERIRLAPEIHEYAIAIVYLDKIYYIRANNLDEMKKWLLDLCKFSKNFDNNQTNSNQLSSKHCIVVDAVTKRSHESISNNNLPINHHNNYQQINNSQINNYQMNKSKDENYLDNNNLPNQLNNNHLTNQYENQLKTKKLINPVFKFLSYVNDINSVDCVDCTNNQNKLNVINDKFTNYQNCDYNNENNLNAQNKLNKDNKINHHSHQFNLPLITSDTNSIKINYDNKLNKFNSQDDTSKLILKCENNFNKSTIHHLIDCKIDQKINDNDYKSSNQRNKSLPDLRTNTLTHKEEDDEEILLKTKDNKTSSIKFNHNYNYNFNNSNLNNNNLKILKTGYLMRKGNRLEWYKHWFILKDRQLTYYRDKTSLLLDGVFDLSLIKQIETDSKFLIINHNLNIIYYPFKIIMWDNKSYELASPLSNDDRNEWINLILNNQIQLNNSNYLNGNQNNNSIDQQIKNKNSNDNEKKENSDAESSDSSTPICQVFTDQIPSSPPLNRNAISKMKYKLKDNIKNKEGKLKLIKHDNLLNKKCLNDTITTTNYTINKDENKELLEQEDEEVVVVVEENVNKILSNNNNLSSTTISSSSVNESSNITNSTTSSTDSLINNHNNDNNSKLKDDNCFRTIDSGLDASSEDNINNYLISNKLSTNDNKIDISKNNYPTKIDLDYQKSIDQLNSDDNDSDSELKRIKFSIVELQKFCLNIINELQLTNNDLTDLKRNLIQKDLLSFLLGNHILNGSLNIDTFTEQLNTLMSNLNKDYQNKTKLNSNNSNCNISSNNSSLNSILNQSSIILEHQSLDNHQTILDKSITSSILNLITDSLSNLQSTKLSPSTSSINLEKSINDQKKSIIDDCEFKTDKTDKIYLTREQFDNLLNKNSKLEQRLSLSLKTLQRLNNELKESYQNYDHLEICNLWMKNEFKSMLKIKRDEYNLMKEKINYLTSKLVQIEKSYKLSLNKLAELNEENNNKI